MRSITARTVAAVLSACLLAACAAQPPATEDSGASRRGPQAPGPACRVGPDGGPAHKAAPLSDRGIGGTGATPVADRGIGGTGIVGVVTGFASVCVDGLEVQYDGGVAVDIDGTRASAAALRVGQVVVIRAAGPVRAARATAISVRSEVSGQVEGIDAGQGTLTVGGQPVEVTAGTRGANSFRLGDWVAVSGLRGPNGLIVATRLDAAPAGRLVARGPVVRDGDTVRVGNLVLAGADARAMRSGQFVKVTGRYVANEAQARATVPDPLFADPAGFFGASVSHLVLQGFVRVEKGAVWLNGRKMNAVPSLHGRPGPEGTAVVVLDRQQDGSYSATGLSYMDNAGTGPAAMWNSAIGGTYIAPPPERAVSVAAPGDGADCPSAGAGTEPAGSEAACADPVGPGSDRTGTPPGTQDPPAQALPLSGSQGDQVISSGTRPAAVSGPGVPLTITTLTQSSASPVALGPCPAATARSGAR
jgi:hypothetical protein